MTVEEQIRVWLESIGADGLCYPDLECGCGIPDLMPCRSWPGYCVPARKGKRTDDDWPGEYDEGYFPLSEGEEHD